MPCKHEGGTDPCDRTDVSRHCKVQAAQYIAANRERIRVKTAQYRAANQKRISAYRMANRERKGAWGAKYRAAHPAKRLIKAAKERARKKNLPFDLDQHLPELQGRIDRGICELTGCCLNNDDPGHQCRPSIDRIVPGKGYVYDNVRLVTRMANTAMSSYGQKALMRLGANLIEKEGGRVEVPKDEFTKGNC